MTNIVKFRKFSEQFNKLIFSLILTVAGGILRDEHELLCFAERFSFGDERFKGIGAVFAADTRDKTVCAVIETSVRDLEIFDMGRRGDDAL